MLVYLSANIELPEIKIEADTKLQIQASINEESQVIVHCSYTSLLGFDQIRIWPSTFLFDRHSAHRCKLLHAINIPLYPVWKEIAPGQTHYFTLIFSALPKACTLFDLIEKIPEQGGFECNNLSRNNTDVYQVALG